MSDAAKQSQAVEAAVARVQQAVAACCEARDESARLRTLLDAAHKIRNMRHDELDDARMALMKAAGDDYDPRVS